MGKSILDNREVPQREVPQKLDGPPKAEDVLTEIASRWLSSNLVRKADQRIPTNPRDLAMWWMRNQSPPDERFDRPTQQSRRDGSGLVWKSPYVDRLRYTLTKFLSLGKEFQGLIIAAAADGIFWRGDSRDFFVSLINEHGVMKSSPDYLAEGMKKMHHLLGRS